MSLSEWWLRDTHSSLRGSRDDKVRLALALGAVRSVVRIIDRTIPPLVVDWDHDGENEYGERSYTDFRGSRIAISAGPMMDKKLPDWEPIDICVGFGMHEASHSMHSRSPYDVLLSDIDAFRPYTVAAMLLNIVEDNRIEGVTSEDYPGFEPYFPTLLGYLWPKVKEHAPATYGPDLKEKMNAIIALCRWPEDSKATLTHPSFAPERAWWTEWQSDYLAERTDVRTTLTRALDHLREDKKTKKELDKMAATEKKNEEAMKNLREAIEQAIKHGINGVMRPCSSEHGKYELDGDLAEEVRKLVREHLKEEQPFVKTANGASNPPLLIRHPEETPESKSAYIGKPSATVQRMKSALVFRQEAPEYDVKLLRSGKLDDHELHRFAGGDYRVFSRRIIEARPSTQLGLLVDMSGSMNGRKQRTAQELAQLLVWATAEMEGVETRVWGHTGDLDNVSAEIYRLYEPHEPMTRLGLITTMESGNNYDGHAIAWCARELMGCGTPDQQRLLIVLSDGYPSGSGYGGSSAYAHVKAVTQWSERNGVPVIQIALDSAMDSVRQASMFAHYIPYESTEQLPKQLERLMSAVV